VFQAFGFAIAGWAKDENQAQPVAQLIQFPMMFLSGTFFPPRTHSPHLLYLITGFLPLTYLADALRHVANDNATLWAVRGDVLGLIVWGVIAGLIAVRVFQLGIRRVAVSNQNKMLVGILVLVVGGLIGLFAIANHSSTSPTGSKTVVRATSHKEGSGPVQVVEFGDFQCPACGAAEPNVEQLLKDYNGKITFYFRNFSPDPNPPQCHGRRPKPRNPLPTKVNTGRCTTCSMPSKVNGPKPADPTSDFVNYAQTLGLDTGKFKQAIQDKQFANVINQDLADGNAPRHQRPPRPSISTARSIPATTPIRPSATRFQSLLKP